MPLYEVDYTFKDAEKWKTNPKDVPAHVVADTVVEAVKKAVEFEDDNLTLLKCNLVPSGKVAVAKKFKGLEPKKETA
jgi:hypothetical protein